MSADASSRLPEFPTSFLVHKLCTSITRLLGPQACRWLGVGRLRRELARELPEKVSDAGARQEALHILKSHCRLCRGCKLGRE